MKAQAFKVQTAYGKVLTRLLVEPFAGSEIWLGLHRCEDPDHHHLHWSDQDVTIIENLGEVTLSSEFASAFKEAIRRGENSGLKDFVEEIYRVRESASS
jgi:hypothetical protein